MLPEDAQAALSRGQVIEAIRIVRARHGIGLAEAKALVDAARQGGALPDAVSAGGDRPLPPEALAALAQGRTIEAIKAVRKAHGLGLKAAKAVVDRHLARQPGRLGHAGAADRWGRGWLPWLLVAGLAVWWFLR